jgi:hypothetical protein
MGEEETVEVPSADIEQSAAETGQRTEAQRIAAEASAADVRIRDPRDYPRDINEANEIMRKKMAGDAQRAAQKNIQDEFNAQLGGEVQSGS